MKLTLPLDSAVRKDIPIRSGCIDYFPAAIAGVAMHSIAGNNKHKPGEPFHHARGKSMDHADCIDRHLMDINDMLAFLKRGGGLSELPKGEQTILEEANALCWRALALSQELHERFGAPLAPAARLPEKNRKEAILTTFADQRPEWEANPVGQALSAAPPDCSPPAAKGRQYAHEACERRTSTPGTVQASVDGKHYEPSARGPL